MSQEDIVDPRAVPRWVEAGVSGIARPREWDAVFPLELGELEGSPASELSFRVLEDGSTTGADAVPPETLARVLGRLEGSVRPPCEVLLVRRGGREWSAAARELRLVPLDLATGFDATEIALAVPPGGERMVLVDGVEQAELSPELESACAELERRGRERFPGFVVRAEQVSPGRFELSIDPL